MNCSSVRYLVQSDIHLGHSRTKTEYIISNLHTFVKNNHNLLKKLDIWFLAGDVYDKLLSSSSKEFVLANEWLSLLAMYCAKHRIKLRILEGTPSHDWRQITVFSKTLETLGVDIDYRYVDGLMIERIDDLGINILYVPDEWNHEASETLDEVNRLLIKHDLQQVDIAIMHGQFGYQLPMIELPTSHDEDYYLGIVKYYINIGHIHTSSVYKRIIAQGSFDRLAHNEEEAKGCMCMTIYHTGDMGFVFLKNKNAYPYKKYDLSSLETQDVIKTLTKELRKLKLGTRVKVIVANNEVNRLLRPLQDKFKDIIFTVDKKKIVLNRVIKDNKIEITPFEICRDNIVSLLTKELGQHQLTKEELENILGELAEVTDIKN